MYFTPTTFLAKLLAAMQVLMTLDVPLSTTLALPVTSKPIESTVENSAWQAWIELPPEQKQQVKSRKVTPKSIFTLPLRVECPEGHRQVDTKCIPIVIGSNDVLIDLNALGLLVGSTQPEDLYDYDDMSDEVTNAFSFGSGMSVDEAEKSVDGLNVELKPPSKDEPLKFNIFENKFHIFHEEPSEDYSALSNEGLQGTEKEQTSTATTAQPTDAATANATAINDLAGETLNFSENNFDFYMQPEKNSSLSDSEESQEGQEGPTFSTLAHEGEFKIDAISVPAFGFETLKQNKLSAVQNESSIHSMDKEATDDRDKPKENDIQTLLQTESFLPLVNQTTATTLQNTGVDENFSLTTVPLQKPSESSSDVFSLNVDDEMTTVPNAMEHEAKLGNKQEYTRSVTLKPIVVRDSDIGDGDGDADGDGDDYGDGGDSGPIKDSTLATVTNIELSEITTPIQLDETTIIETYSSLSFTPSTQPELKELLLQKEQTQKDFEQLQRTRKGQDDQHVVLKKSKVQPVEVLSPSSNTTTATANLPTATKSPDELKSSTAETVTPLLADHNENDNNNNNNDRFYYQHLKNHDNEVTQRRPGSEFQQKPPATTTTTAAATVPVSATGETATKSTEIATSPLTSEIDLAEELRLINALVKGMRPTATTTTTTTSTTTTTTEKPKASTVKTTTTNDIPLSSSLNSPSESLPQLKKPTLSTSQIWSKIMPLLTTSSTTPMPKSSRNDQQETSSSARSNRNSKIIRIESFNDMSAAKKKINDFNISSTTTTTTTTATTFYDTTPPSLTAALSSSTTTSENQSSSKESNTYEPYWWLPVAWRLNTSSTSSVKQPEEQEEVKSEEQPLLLRFWSAYTPKSS